MTYGVDQCRVCGKNIKVRDAESMRRYVQSRRRKPTMTEKQWRAAGFKDAPTRLQTWKRMDGCCYECQLPTGLTIAKPFAMLLPVVAVTIAFIAFIFTVAWAFA